MLINTRPSDVSLESASLVETDSAVLKFEQLLGDTPPAGGVIGFMGGHSTIWLGMLFGAIGAGYLIYGRKQRRGMALLSGIVLMVFPYFVSNVWLSLLLGAGLMALPFIVTY